jgi:hypothetical protein
MLIGVYLYAAVFVTDGNFEGAQESIPRIDSASLCKIAGRYVSPFPNRFLAHIDCYKMPALSNAINSVYRGRI